MSRRDFSKRNQAVIDLYNSGQSIRSIADSTGLTLPTLRHIINKNRHKLTETPLLRYYNRFHTHDTDILRLRADGLKYREIAKKLGCSYYSVVRLCKKNASPVVVYKEPEFNYTDDQVEAVLDLAGLAAPYRVIKAVTGLSRSHVDKILIKYDLYPKPSISNGQPPDPEDIEDYHPAPSDPKYPDDFELKPHHRARLEAIKHQIWNQPIYN